MTDISKAGTFTVGTRTVKRLGYGAMQLAGKGVFGPPKDRKAAVAVLREAVASGVNHIDTSDFYGPHITNQIIREALHPYPEDLVICTKVGAVRGDDGSWLPAAEPERQDSPGDIRLHSQSDIQSGNPPAEHIRTDTRPAAEADRRPASHAQRAPARQRGSGREATPVPS